MGDVVRTRETGRMEERAKDILKIFSEPEDE
jgi:hypothetical protein